MASTSTTTTIQLTTLTGIETRKVSTAPPRPASLSEIPIIDLTPLNGDEEARKNLAAQVRNAAQGSGFFYIKNHGIPQSAIAGALEAAKSFYAQSEEDKMRFSGKVRGSNWGYKGSYSTQINKSESKDTNETFTWRYDPQHDPTHANTPSEHTVALREAWLWDQARRLPDFKEKTIAYWTHCLALARKLVRIFALALNLPEGYFDAVITHPGADGLYVHYPGTPPSLDTSPSTATDAGLGSHTDIQCFTLLWQDTSGGLQVLSSAGEWLEATPVADTFVVNIADFLQRLSNDRFTSTVHRVYNRQEASRFSMPFFFGFNRDAVCSVVPTCVDERNPPRYEPITCGEWVTGRLALVQAGNK